MNQRIFVDTNVLMDVLLECQPHYDDSAAVWSAVDEHDVVGWVSANSFTTMYYLLRRFLTPAAARESIQEVRAIFSIAPVNAALIEKALYSPFDDFEDAVQYECALRVKATTIITRDERHFRRASISVMTPRAFLASLDLM